MEKAKTDPRLGTHSANTLDVSRMSETVGDHSERNGASSDVLKS